MKNKLFYLIASFIVLVSISRETYSQTTNSLDTLNASLLKAQTFARNGNTEEASKIYITLMKAFPDNKEAVKGWLIVNMKRTPTGEEDAIKSLEELGRQYPDNTGIMFFKAFLEAEYGHNDAALTEFDKLIQLQPDSALNFVGKGQVLFAMGKYGESFNAFDRATSLDPQRQDVWGMKAGALVKMGKLDEALVSVNKGLELNPNDAVSIYNRACMYSLKGNKVNALADLKKAISLNSSFKDSARKDEDFKSLYNDEDFKRLTE